MSFIEDTLLTTSGGITHHGEIPAADEELSPSLEIFSRLLHPSLPRLVKQRYGTKLRSRTLTYIKPKISQALESLLDEVHASAPVKSLTLWSPDRSLLIFPAQHRPPSKPRAVKSCPLCQHAGRPGFRAHVLSSCKFLPEPDRLFMSRIRQVAGLEFDESSPAFRSL